MLKFDDLNRAYITISGCWPIVACHWKHVWYMLPCGHWGFGPMNILRTTRIDGGAPQAWDPRRCWGASGGVLRRDDVDVLACTAYYLFRPYISSSFFKLTRPRSPMRAPLCTYMRSVSHHFLSHHYYILVPIMIIVYLARPIVGFGGAMRGYRI